jgi:hypothetical protein
LNRRVLYILIVVLVLIIGFYLLRGPILGRGGAKPTAGARTRKAKTPDTSAVVAKTARAQAKRGAKGKAVKGAEVAVKEVKAPEPAEAPSPRDTTPLAWGGDPFVRDWLLAGELRDLKLKAVTLGERPLALINDRVVARGDTVSGKRVAEITRDSVVLEFGGQRRGLKIGD